MCKNEKIKNFKEVFIYLFAGLIAMISFVLVAMLYFIKVPEVNEPIIHMSLGAIIGSGLTMIIGYFFGSSKSSADKNEIMNDK